MTDLSHRSTELELMDRPETSPADYAKALADLATVNRVTLTHRPVLRWLDAATRDRPQGATIVALDVGCGQGDLLRAIHRWGTSRGLRLALSGLDLNARSAEQAKAATPSDMGIVWRTGNVFDHVPDPAPEFIVCSQFAHHLDDDADVVAFLLWLERHARSGWYVADLHRHRMSYYGFRLLARSMGWHRIVRIDGTISIARSFRPADWRRFLATAEINAEITRHLLFRLCVGRLKCRGS